MTCARACAQARTQAYIYALSAPKRQSDERRDQNPYYYSVRAAYGSHRRVSARSELDESGGWWSFHGLGAYSAQRGAEAKSPSTLQ